jgi:hypothetical protein
VAQGQSSVIISAYTGNVSSGSGTSFSSPITAGMVACLWQANPGKRNTEIMDAIRQSASLANDPTAFLGYGIPDYLKADSLLSAPLHITLSVKLFLEGSFNDSDMDAKLNPILPLYQPYEVEPFYYSGEEEVAAIPGDDIVDWIFLEIREATSAIAANGSSVIARQAAFLKKDGSIVDTSGNNFPMFNLTFSDSLFLVVRHRNHLAVMSSTALKNDGENIYSYDFTTGVNKVFGGSAGYKDLGGGIFALVAGDGNADGKIDLQDKSESWEIKAGKQEYHPGDYNCNTQIDNTDKDDFWFLNRIFISQVPE